MHNDGVPPEVRREERTMSRKKKIPAMSPSRLWSSAPGCCGYVVEFWRGMPVLCCVALVPEGESLCAPHRALFQAPPIPANEAVADAEAQLGLLA
jgi:hypothetical protein